MEPLLGPVDLSLDECWIPEDCYELRERPHWVSTGGESCQNARPSHPYWFRSIRDQCVAAGVPDFQKQWGEGSPYCWFDGPDSEDDADREYGLDWERDPH